MCFDFSIPRKIKTTMDGDGDTAKVKKVILDGLKRFKPEVQIEQSPTSGYLHIWVISDAFENYWSAKTLFSQTYRYRWESS